MKSPVCIVILLLALAQINAIAGLECRCMKRFINLASQEFKGDKEAWLDEADEVVQSLELDRMPFINREIWLQILGDGWPGCKSSKCNIEPGNEIWKIRFEQLRQRGHLPGEEQLKPACIEVNSTMMDRMTTHEFSCGFDYEQLQRSINHSSRIQDRNCTNKDVCLVRPFDPAKDTPVAVKPVVPSSLECRCKMRYINSASKEFVTDLAKWADEQRRSYKEAYGKDIFAGMSREDVMNASAARWPECERWRCKMEPDSEFWNRRKQQFEKYYGRRVPANAAPACLRLHLRETAEIEKGSTKFIDMEAFVCGFKFRRLEGLIDGPGGSRSSEDGNCTGESPAGGIVRTCVVRTFDPRTDAAAATNPVIAMLAAIQLLVLIANKLQIVATGPD